MLGVEVRRRASSLRQTVRRNVEEPLAAYYFNVRGEELGPSLYSSALSDTDEWSKERMRELKRAARRKPENPTNPGS